MKSALVTETQQKETFGDRLEGHRRALIVLALDRTGRREAAEEIAQQVIVKAWEHRAELRDAQALGGWLWRIAINCCIQWQRRESRAALSTENPFPLLGSSEAAITELLRRETIRETRQALQDVPLKNRVALLMQMAGYSYDEISQFLKVPVSTVRGRVARAREQLRRDLARRLDLCLKEKG